MSSDPPKKSKKSMFRALFSKDASLLSPAATHRLTRPLQPHPPSQPAKPSTRREDIAQAFDSLSISSDTPPRFVGGFNPGFRQDDTTRYNPSPSTSTAPWPFPNPGPLPVPPRMPMPSLTMQHAQTTLQVPRPTGPPSRPHSESVLPPPAFVLSPSPCCTPGLSPPPPSSLSAHVPKPVRQGRGRSASTPAATASGTEKSKTQCSGVTKAGKQCTRTVKTGPPLSSVNPDLAIERFCFQHAKELMGPSGFYARNPTKDVWVTFADWIPGYLQAETQVALRAEMEKPRSVADVDGYIYTFEIRDPTSPTTIKLKVGRTVHLIKRIDQWGKQCGTKEQVLRGWWPGTVEDEDEDGTNRGADGSLMKGRVQQGKKGRFCHRLERLVHLELADLAMGGAYLDGRFPAVECPEGGGKAALKRACVDCERVHKEIFEFQRVEKGKYKGKEWECIVKPVIEKWGSFVQEYV